MKGVTVAKKVKVIGSPGYFQPWADIKRHEGYGAPWMITEGRTYRRLLKTAEAKRIKKGGKP